INRQFNCVTIATQLTMPSIPSLNSQRHRIWKADYPSRFITLMSGWPADLWGKYALSTTYGRKDRGPTKEPARKRREILHRRVCRHSWTAEGEGGACRSS